MNRRYVSAALAVLALGFVVASPAHAGGASSGAAGVKKNANLTIKNTTSTPYYLVVIPSSLANPTTFNDAKKLGGVLLNGNKSVVYPVPAGSGKILATSDLTITGTSALPSGIQAPYTVGKGKMAYYKIITSSGTASIVSGK